MRRERTYSGKSRVKLILKILLVVAVIALAALIFMFFYFQRYIVFYADGIQLEIPWLK